MSEGSGLIDRVGALTAVRVLVVGDVMLDRFVYGAVERISPEAPIPVLRVERETAMLGGAGNVVRNLVALGARSRLASVVGDDAAGEELRALLSAETGLAFSLVTAPSRRTTLKSRFLAGNQQIMRADRETVAALSQGIRAAVIESALTLLADSAVLILSDYGKGVLDDGVAGDLIAIARATGTPVVVDPKGRDYARYRGADVITPNRSELGEATGRSIADAAAAEAAARRLIDSHNFGSVVATLGKDGMVLVPAGAAAHHLPAEAREVFDVSGAGDTVVATMAAALAGGATAQEAAALANVAAGIVVGKVGTAVAYASELETTIRHRVLSDAEAKVVPLAPALDRVEAWRRQGLRIGFTNGCFDLLHPGHVSLLTQARRACDRLIVGLNSDDSVARLKGPSRPVQREEARAAVLASLTAVDLVVIFGDDTPIGLIEAVRPDVLVKGADYRPDQVVGGDVVRGWGGTVMLARLEPGFSTTATIARIAE
jgi:D-beta-D-heptose 7-phosphate kinase/D-beta-D-heptose 1-phosphate adenosyltransferase